jgi:hypothetical protein
MDCLRPGRNKPEAARESRVKNTPHALKRQTVFFASEMQTDESFDGKKETNFLDDR